MNQKHISGNTKLAVFAQSIFGQPSRSPNLKFSKCVQRSIVLYTDSTRAERPSFKFEMSRAYTSSTAKGSAPKTG